MKPDGTTNPVFLGATGNILTRLSGGQLVGPTFRLNGNHELLSVLIDADIDLVDFDLTEPFHRSSHVVLQRIRGDAQEDVNQTVVPDPGEKGLFVAKSVGADDLRSTVGDLGGQEVPVATISSGSAIL